MYFDMWYFSVPEHTMDDQKGLESLFVMNLVDS